MLDNFSKIVYNIITIKNKILIGCTSKVNIKGNFYIF